MGPRLPERASDYSFYRDRSYWIDKQRNAKRQGQTLSPTDLNGVYISDSKTGKVYNLYDEVKDFFVQGQYGNGFGLNNQMQYSLFLQCQSAADKNQDGKFSDEEYSNFKEMLRNKVATMPNCAQIEGLESKQEVAQAKDNLNQNI